MMDEPRPERREPGSDDERIKEEAEKNREKLEEIPPPGTDPLHEGP